MFLKKKEAILGFGLIKTPCTLLESLPKFFYILIYCFNRLTMFHQSNLKISTGSFTRARAKSESNRINDVEVANLIY